MNNKQSSVEWFSQQSWKLKVKLENKEITIGEYGVTYVDLLKQAKEKHGNEVRDAFYIGRYEYNNFDSNSTQYYNETYGNEQQ